MKLLIDTHVLLWHGAGDKRLPARTIELLESPQNDLIMSVASAWEIIIKAAKRKLKLDRPARDYIEYYRHDLNLSVISMTIEHIYHVAMLPLHHSDPFDRVLVAQSLVERLPILTNDPLIQRYGVQTIW